MKYKIPERNLIMRVILIARLMLLLIATVLSIGCAKTSASMYDPITGNKIFEVKTLTIKKDIKDAHLDTTGEGVKFDLGSSEAQTLSAEELAALACLRDSSKC